ncbi:hypothetical protein ACI2L4_30330 [Streptomyces sparsogenes]|uniref:hypothetical protein n=1 Tax=Streptomyces sparsogenes TaxID=67365 RepID=UPI0033E1BA92
MKKYFRVLGALVVAVGALAYGGVASHADTYRWPFPGAGTAFSPFPTHDPADGVGSRCVNISYSEARQHNDCDSRSSVPAPAPAPAGGKPVPKPV